MLMSILLHYLFLIKNTHYDCLLYKFWEFFYLKFSNPRSIISQRLPFQSPHTGFTYNTIKTLKTHLFRTCDGNFESWLESGLDHGLDHLDQLRPGVTRVKVPE